MQAFFKAHSPSNIDGRYFPESICGLGVTTIGSRRLEGLFSRYEVLEHHPHIGLGKVTIIIGEPCEWSLIVPVLSAFGGGRLVNG